MSHQALAMSETATSTATTDRTRLDETVSAVRSKMTEFARLPVREKTALVEACIPTLMAHAEEWVRAGCRAKGIDFDAPVSGEEWLAGPMLTMRNLRLLAQSLRQIERSGAPEFGRGVKVRADGRVQVGVFPSSKTDAILYQGFSAYVLLEEGVTEREARERQASFHKKKDPQGAVTLVLGAGNVSSIPPMDALYKLFVDGNVCVVKMNPVNEYLGHVFEKAFAPLIERDYMRIVYGDGDVGAYLCQHAGIDDIHITGSDRTHDLIVWGPPGPERDRRKAAKEPLLQKTITSELGNVSPVMIVPGEYSAKELEFVARNVASQVTNNASFNCNAAKMLVTAEGWAQKDDFLRLFKTALSRAATRKAYYPGADDRYRVLTEGRKVEKIGTPGEGELPWTIIEGLDAEKDEPQFTTEPFCSVISHVELAAREPDAFVTAAAKFANDKLWGTLNACIVVHPREEQTPKVAAALEQAIVDLRYGTVAINHWPALGYGFVTTPWGGHPSSTLENIRSGIGWVHNTYMIEGIEKSVVRGPLVVSPKPPWFFDNKNTPTIARKVMDIEARPSVFKIPGIVLSALRG